MSADFLYAEVVGDRNALRNLDLMPDTVRAVLLAKVEVNVERLKDAVEAEITPSSKSGKLLSAVRSEVINNKPGRVEGRVYIDETVAPYARAQDKGASIPAHIIRPKQAKVLAFMGATGDKVFATRVFHPGGQIPPKNFMANARRTLGGAFSRDIKKAIVEGIRQNMRAQS